MKAILRVLCAVGFAALVLGQEAGKPIVSTQFGKVQGTTGQSRDGRMFYSFRGIPYGKVAERFQAPVDPEKWEFVKNAGPPAKKCVQYTPLSKEVVGQEDCLSVNVHTPKLPVEGQDKILIPVVVYIHAGLNNFGSNEDLDPKFFMDEDVIFVMPNYRLGVFGFLNTGDMYAPGNAGLKDQVKALKWVQENIEKFGGDKSRVTIMGSGSGAADAFMHTTSPASKGLISGVISMGGATLSRTSFIMNPVKQAKKLGAQIGCPVDSSSALITCLKSKDANEILEKMTKLDIKRLNVGEKAWFGPTVDKMLAGQTESDLIVPDNPIKLLKEGKIVNKVPLILGGNAVEGVQPITAEILKEKSLFEKLDKQWSEIAPTLFIYRDTATDKDEVSKKIRESYFGDKEISEETFPELSNVFMDRFMGFGVVVMAQLYSKHAPVYMYLFAHQPQTTGLKYFGVDKNYGMGHLDELQYLFKVNINKFPYPEITNEHAEVDISKGLVKALGSFAENGKPTKSFGGVPTWEKIDAGNPSKWFIITGKDNALGPLPDYFNKRVVLWTELYGKELAKEKETPVQDEF